jgi:hypothetical protein
VRKYYLYCDSDRRDGGDPPGGVCGYDHRGSGDPMKILITGSTYSHFNGHMYFTKSPTVSQHLKDGLVLAGHKVSMQCPEDIIAGKNDVKYNFADYDVALFGLTPCGSISARFQYYEYDLYSRCRKAGMRTAWFIDDWQWYQLAAHMRTLMNTYDKRASQLAGTRRKGTEEYFLSVKSKLGKTFADFQNGTSSPIIMVFFDPDGSVEPHAVKRMCGNKILPVDPSGVFPLVDVPEQKRKKQWILAALGDYSKFLSGLELKWPVELLGPTSGHKDHMLEEYLIRDVYGSAWGQIIPQYPVKVGKLWRSRYVHSAMAGSVALTTSDEVKEIFGGPYNLTGRYVESLNTMGLDRLAGDQRDSFLQNTWSAEQFAERMNKIVRNLK